MATPVAYRFGEGVETGLAGGIVFGQLVGLSVKFDDGLSDGVIHI